MASCSYLEVVFAGDLLELGKVGGELGHLNVHGRTDSGTQVGGAEGEEAEAVVVREGDTLLNVVHRLHQTAVHFLKVASHLHGDQTKVVLFVTPNQEGFVVVVVDTTASGPEAARVGSLKFKTTCKLLTTSRNN